MVYCTRCPFEPIEHVTLTKYWRVTVICLGFCSVFSHRKTRVRSILYQHRSLNPLVDLWICSLWPVNTKRSVQISDFPTQENRKYRGRSQEVLGSWPRGSGCCSHGRTDVAYVCRIPRDKQVRNPGTFLHFPLSQLVSRGTVRRVGWACGLARACPWWLAPGLLGLGSCFIC